MDIIERAARALCYADRDYQFCANNCRIKGECVGEIDECQRNDVRAVLSALREPILEIVDRHGGGYDRSDYGAGMDAAQSLIYRDIDEALKG